MKIISASIDLSKIDKSRIIDGKNGTKYYNITIIVKDEKDKYENDCAVAEGQTKEERTAKKDQKYLGNGRTVYDKPGAKSSAPKQSYGDHDDLPF